MNTVASRRAILVGASVALFAAASCSKPALRNDNQGRQVSLVADPDFLTLSQALTGYADLDPITAARLSAAFAEIAPDHHARIKPLFMLVHAGVSPDDLLGLADRASLGPTALAIVAAWYTGTAGSGVKAITVAYRDALMQRPVADALSPPTYALGGPAWWTSPPPDVGLSRLSARAPTTVGDPGPKTS
jgi:hypothetical protein